VSLPAQSKYHDAGSPQPLAAGYTSIPSSHENAKRKHGYIKNSEMLAKQIKMT